jgi:hypothetical protein
MRGVEQGFAGTGAALIHCALNVSISAMLSNTMATVAKLRVLTDK